MRLVLSRRAEERLLAGLAACFFALFAILLMFPWVAYAAGTGCAMLDHIIGEARRLRMTSPWLETGSAAAFVPALKLYESAGFTRCEPVRDYKPDPFSLFMTRPL
jgi:hypothetical protein